MRIEISDTRGCAVNNFVVHAENPSEAAIMRQFVRFGYAPTRQRLFMHSHGGNIAENVESFCFGWRAESDFKPKRWWNTILASLTSQKG